MGLCGPANGVGAADGLGGETGSDCGDLSAGTNRVIGVVIAIGCSLLVSAIAAVFWGWGKPDQSTPPGRPGRRERAAVRRGDATSVAAYFSDTACDPCRASRPFSALSTSASVGFSSMALFWYLIAESKSPASAYAAASVPTV